MMKLLLNLILLFNFVACYQQSNSHTQDSSSSMDATGSEKFRLVYDILVDKCIGCHHEFEKDNAYNNETNFKNVSGLIKPGDAVNSYLVQRIRGCGTGAAADMPESGSSISSEDCETIKDWINSLE